MTRLNTFFAFIARQHYYKFLALGAVLAIVFSLFVEITIPMLKPLANVLLIVICSSAFLELLTRSTFYEDLKISPEELEFQTGYIVVKDTFFSKMIQSPIGKSRRVYGYLYIICRFLYHTIMGYLLMIIICVGAQL